MNPHTLPPDEGQGPSGAPSGQPHPASAGPSGPAGPGAPPPLPSVGAVPPQPGVPLQGFFGWIRSQGIYRGRERWVGGVASGIAQRLGVDPLIVRGVLIVLGVFAGVGVLLYGLAWALLPEPDGRIHLEEAGAGRWTAGMTGALVTTIIGLPGLGSGVWGWHGHGSGGFIWTVLWLGGAGYLAYYLVRRNKARNRTASMAPPQQPGGPVNLAKTSSPAPAAGEGNAPAAAFAGTAQGQIWGPGTPGPVPGGYGPVPGGYGPVPGGPMGGGYGPTGGTPAPAGPRNPGPGTPAVAVTAGLALLAGGGVKALDAANAIHLGNAGSAVVWATGAAVLGLGILVAGLRGRTSGILGFFAVVALIMGAVFNVMPSAERFHPRNADWTPTGIEQARNGFEITGGTGTADLTQLALDPPLAADVVVPIDATASNLTVLIPDTVPVHIEADMAMGNLTHAGGNHSGMMRQQRDYNAGKPGARLVLKVSGTMSNVTIQERN